LAWTTRVAWIPASSETHPHQPAIAQTFEDVGKLSYGQPRPLRVLEG
jgi:hypothetical protein